MNIFSKINQHLLERFPNIWNTKIVWILLIALGFHLIFFFIGFVSHTNPLSMQEFSVTSSFFSGGLILANVVITILILVGWLVYMFKNNAFKNFYPISNLKLFGQYIQYFIIVLISSTFYLSYMFGFQTYIKSKYNNSKMLEQIELANNVAAFFSHDPNDYLLTQKKYPEIFSKLYCETDPNKIDKSKKYYTYYNSLYQFNDLYTVVVTDRDSLGRFIYPAREASNAIDLAYSDEQEKKCIFYFKKNVVDVSKYINNANLNYGNFSTPFYKIGQINDDFYRYGYNYETSSPNSENIEDGIAQNKRVYDLIQRNNKEEFKKLFSDFLKMSDDYKIKHNLTPEKWLELVYNSPNFEVKNFILSEQPDSNGYYYNEPDYYEEASIAEPADAAAYAYAGEGNTSESPEVTARREYIKSATTKYYLETKNLKKLFENVDEIKNYDFLESSLPVFLWLAFVFSNLVFSFRVTNLRALLFSFITAGVISLVSALFFVVIGLGFSGNIMFSVAYYALIIGTLIIVIPIVSNFGSKLFRSILINISVNGFSSYLFLILVIINLHQEEACSKLRESNVEYQPCPTLLDSLDPSIWSLLIIVCSLIFLFCYTTVIKKWKSSPE